MGMSVDEILTTPQHLSPSQVHSALAYYFDHHQEIDRELEVSTDVEQWKQEEHAWRVDLSSVSQP